MEFTYKAYMNMLDLVKEKGYIFCNYTNYKQFDKAVILRHDIDFSLEKAIEFARLEYNKDIRSTYFILLSTEFYNIFSKKSYKILKEIKDLRHDIGLHFDEKRYEINSLKDLEYWVKKEVSCLESLIDCSIYVVSMHRPSKWILENDIRFERIINSYSKTFFEEFKYLSDSRMYWREDVIRIIENQQYNKLHILTHPFWYSDKEETMKEKLINFINNSKMERYYNIKDNLRNIEEVLKVSEI